MGLVDAPKAGLKVEGYTPPQEIIDAVEKIVGAVQIDVGSIEYIVDDRDGSIVYYDINALSNFVANALQILGFDPHVRLVDYLEQETDRGQCAMGIGSQSSTARSATRTTHRRRRIATTQAVTRSTAK